ncbi:MAG: SGNH/GDSL hydrolase family protein [Nitrospinota bacterium]|nr:SGNH/GDSL hydrolase family protein [Nitrospinota bacterium]
MVSIPGNGSWSADSAQTAATARRSALAIGFFMMATALLLNDHVASAFKKEFFTGKVPAWIHYLRAVLFLSGAAVVYWRRSAILRRTVGRAWAAITPVGEILGFLLIAWLLMESASHAILFNMYPAKKLHAAFINTGYVEEGVRPYLPHLWRNYVPNPTSGIVNQYGFRWGGGEKKSKNRILCIGGSTTWGQGVDDIQSTYPAHMENYLRARGYDVDTINAGLQYYSSAEDLTTLLFAGLYQHPDIVIIYTGVNDVEAIMSPNGFAVDYSHWRQVDPALFGHSANIAHSIAWMAPSWTVRLAATLAFEPDGSLSHTVSMPMYRLGEALHSTNPIAPNATDPITMNVTNMVGAARENGAVPVLVNFSIKVDHPTHEDSYFNGMDQQRREEIRARWRKAEALINGAVSKVAAARSVPLIPFHTFQPEPPGEFFDQCHLNEAGLRQQAEFFGDFLIEKGLLKK